MIESFRGRLLSFALVGAWGFVGCSGGDSTAVTTVGPEAAVNAPVRTTGPIPRELIQANDAAGVGEAIRQGGDVNATYDKYGLHALHVATAYRALGVLDVLIVNGADVDKPSRAGETALMNSITAGSAQCVRRLLKAGAQVDLVNVGGEAALHYAAHLDHVEILRQLLDEGAKTEVADKQGSTPLLRACRRGSVESVKLLLERGANPQARDAQGRNALDIAQAKSRTKIVELLRARD